MWSETAIGTRVVAELWWRFYDALMQDKSTEGKAGNLRIRRLLQKSRVEKQKFNVWGGAMHVTALPFHHESVQGERRANSTIDMTHFKH